MLRKLANAGLIIFLVVSVFLMILYVAALVDKILRPQFKNLPMEDYTWLGLIMTVFLIIDIFIIKRLFGDGKGEQ